jgi:hypothetical protein
MVAIMVVIVGAGVAYANSSSSETTTGDDEGDDSYKGSVSAPAHNTRLLCRSWPE